MAAPNGNPQLWFIVSGRNADPIWGGVEIWASFDDATFLQIGASEGPAKQGILTASLSAPSGANPDVANTLSVDLGISGEALPTATDGDGASGRTLCYVDGELIAYGSAVPIGAHAYQLTDLYRGLFGSAASAHASATAFGFLDDCVFKYNLPPNYVGQPIYFKFRSFNIWGGGRPDLSTVASVAYTPVGTGLGFSNSTFMSLLYRGATVSLGDIANGARDVFECGDIGDAVGELLELGSI